MFVALWSTFFSSKWHYTVFFGFIRYMFPNTRFTKVYMTNITVERGDGSLTKVTPDDILETETVQRIHDVVLL